MKRVASFLLTGFVLLVGVMVVRTVGWRSRQMPAQRGAPLAVDADGAATRLAGAIRIPTISEPEDALDANFAEIQAYLERTFPRVHSTLQRETIGPRGVLYTWRGVASDLPPIVLMGHLDVVPVQPGTEGAWKHAAFSGDLADGFIWGRGALDDKVSVLGILEGVEALIARRFAPRRTVLLAFGCDEEIGGAAGAARIAEVIQQKGIRPWLVIDEGGLIATGIVPGVQGPVALVGIAEKGFMSVELSAQGAGGHSSMPPPHTSVGVVARAVSRLEQHRFPGRLEGVISNFFDYVGPEMPFGMRFFFANRWLFGPVIERKLEASPETDAAIRTTTAATMFEGSPKDNVLPARARAVVNFRILPGDDSRSVLEHVRRVVADPAVTVKSLEEVNEPSSVSSTDSPGWIALQRTIHQVFPDAVVAPYLVLGATDARYYSSLSSSVYRFLPVRLTSSDLARLHGTDERISAAAYSEAVQFYGQLLRNTAQ
ncbi:MAG TPA: M20 family peptidase [Thermoanaerobaculia bacterium]